MNRQRLILFILLIGFAVAVIWSFFAYPRQKRVSPSQPTAAVQRTYSAAAKRTAVLQPAAQQADARVVNMALLDAEQPSFKGYRRNIFKSVFVDEVKVMKQKASAMKPPQTLPAKPEKTPAVERPILMPEVSQRELARFTFLGFMKKDNHKTVFLAKDKDIILVKEGSKFAGRYQAVSITDQALTIIVTDTGDEIVIPLIENKPLVSVK